MTPRAQNGGFIKAILGIIVALIILQFVFGVDVRQLFESPKIREVAGTAWGAIKAAAIAVWEFIRSIGEYIKAAV